MMRRPGRRFYVEQHKVLTLQRHFWFSNPRPKFHGEPMLLHCWCGDLLSMECLERGRLSDLSDFLNAHAACVAKESL
jgi:hypothetical protein